MNYGRGSIKSTKMNKTHLFIYLYCVYKLIIIAKHLNINFSVKYKLSNKIIQSNLLHNDKYAML